MKRRHNLVAFGVAALMSICGAGQALAAVNAGLDVIDQTRTGSVTIHKYDEEGTANLPDADGEEAKTIEAAMASHAVEGVEYTYVRLGDVQTQAVSDDKGEHIRICYDVPDAFASILSLSGGTTIQGMTGTYYTSDTISAAMQAALSSDRVIATKNALFTYLSSASGTGRITTRADGAATISALPLGLYLFAETKVPQNISTANPFLVSLPMTAKDGDTWLYTLHVYPKNQHSEPTMDKLIKTDHSDAFADFGTASIGDTIAYRVVTKLPEIQDKATYLTTWQLTDTLNEGLAYLAEDGQSEVSLRVYDTQGAAAQGGEESKQLTLSTQDYQVSLDKATARQMVITLTQTGLEKVNNPVNSGKYLVYSYEARLTARALLGDSGNDNSAKLTYGRTNTDYTQTVEDKARVYTYGLDLTKTLSDDPENAQTLLPTVQFTLYDVTRSHEVSADLTTEAGIYRVNAENTAGYTFSPSSTGKLKIEGLSAGTYRLTEVKSASGYALLKAAVMIEITSSRASATAGTAGHNDNNTADSPASTAASMVTAEGATALVDSEEVSMTSSAGSTTAYVPAEIINTKTWIPSLPKTGGRGMWLLVIAGAVIVGFSLFYLLTHRKAER